MAKKKKSSKGDKDKAKAEAQRQEDIARLKDETRVGGEIADGMGLTPGHLGRVDESLPSFGADPNILNTGELLARLRSESFGGGYNNAQQDESLALLGSAANTAGNRTADTAEAIARRRANLDTAGNISPELRGVQDLLRSEYANSRNVDPEVQHALDKAKSGLGGLTAEENQALMELQTADAQRGFGGAARQLAGAGLTSGVGANPALVRKLADDYGRNTMMARNDILARNIDVQDRRLDSYGNMARLVDEAKFGRAQSTLGRYGDYTTALDDTSFNRSRDALDLFERSVAGAESDEFNRGNAARSAYTGAVEANTVNNRSDRMARLQNYQDELFRTKADNFQRVTTNINTNAAELSSRTGVVLGVPQYLESVRTSREANDISRKAVDAAGGGGGGGGGESHSGGGGMSDSDSFDSPRSQRSVASGAAL
jgi:hypothetical protein